MNNQKLSEDFLEKIINFTAGSLPHGIIESFIRLLEKELKSHFFTYSSESNLLRIITAMYDKRAFVTDAVQYPHYIEILLQISVNSNYLTDILVRNPEYFYRVVNPSNLNKTFSPEEYRKLISETADNYKTFNGKINSLRTVKRREMLRIGLRDINKISGLEEITAELSALAKGVSAQLFEICYNEIIERNNISKINNRYCIISLGKLGGGELNYSSDIDLMIFYDKDTRYNKKEYSELLTEAIHLFIEQASSITGSGYLYRVDFRLRPHGRNAPLCSNISEYLNYYESRGEDWERQMLIKAGFLSGDKDLYNKFMNYLQPFIYPSTFRNSPAEQIRKLKLNIENALKDLSNIKLAKGGIRDIEFTVQALQLINGYRNKNLRSGNTIQALRELNKSGLIDNKEFGVLYDSYTLFRKVEHYLQLMNDLQTHTIPAGGEMLSKLALFLGFNNKKNFLDDIEKKREDISNIFLSVTGTAEAAETDSDEIKFANKKQADKDLNFLREGKGLLGTREFDTQSINAFLNIERDLMNYLAVSNNPDLVLKNFVRVIKSAGFPSVWYKSLTNKKLLTSFLTICEYSQRAVDLFAEDTDLQEFFLSGNVFKKQGELKSFPAKRILFMLSVQLCIKQINEEVFSSIISTYFYQRIASISEEYLKKGNFLIAALGSFGIKEMSFASDIDLLFITDKTNPLKDQQKIFLGFLTLLKKEFIPFDTDCRLRPEGKTSQLVWDINSFNIYIENRARIWELQAFTKLNYICGDKKLFRRLTVSVKRRIEKETTFVILKEVREMRKKLYPADISGVVKIFDIKKNPGGLTDIEFLIQYLILCYPELYSKCRGKKILQVLKYFDSYISKTDEIIISEAYRFFRLLDLTNQNMFNINTHRMPGEVNKREAIAEYMGYSSADEFMSTVKKYSRRINIIYDKYMVIIK